jgi:signal transduction histidine kinase
VPVLQWYRNLSLVARFTAAGLALTVVMGGLLVTFVGQRMERTAMEHEAWSVSETVAQVVGPAIAASDFDASDHVAREKEIAGAEDTLNRDSRIRSLRIWSADGTLLFGPDIEMVGTQFHISPMLARALDLGEVTWSHVLVPDLMTDNYAAGLQTFAPIRARDGSVLGAYEIQHATKTIVERIHEALRMLWITVAGGLLFLYAVLFGIVKRASSELEWHHREVNELSSRCEIDRMKSEFASMISHELRAPLTSLIGYSELLLSRGPRKGPEHEWAERIHRQSERMEELLDDVLRASLVEESAVVVSVRAMDLPSVVTRTIANLPLTKPNPAIVTDLPPNLPPILADREKLELILTNLLGNAIKYSPEGGEIRMSAAPVNGRVRLSVIDHGLGISPSDLPRLFERFHRIHARSYPEIHGTGLGLYISRRLAEMQGGHLWAESQGAGLGSVFHLELPLAPVNEAVSTAVSQPRLAVGASR